MNSKLSYGYPPNEQGTGYQINPGTATKLRRLFEQAAAGHVAIYTRTIDPGKEATPKRAAIYARVAVSQEQGTPNVLEAQIKACQEHCERRGYPLEHVYQDTASGAQLDRPMLNALRQAAREHQFTVLVVWDYGRLARKTALLATLLSELEEAGITVRSLCDAY
jgi:predicted site-specific integrase-resolvase